MVKGFVIKVIPPEDGDYVIITPCKKTLGFGNFTCSMSKIEEGFPKEGDCVSAFSVHQISHNRWRAEKVVILKDKRKNERK